MSEDNKLAVKIKMPSFKRGIAANRHQAEQTLKELDPNTVPNRLGLVFDDSGSMAGQAIEDAKNAIKNFTLSCNFNDTSIAMYPLNKENKPLTVDYDLVNIFVLGIIADGGTPMYTTLLKMIENEKLTRAVVFSDGSPTDSKLLGQSEYWDSKPSAFAANIVQKYKDKEIPVDTIYIGVLDTSSGYKELKHLAELTGGVFIHFKDSQSLSNNLKYLAPRYRALLANAELKEKVQRGESI